MSFDPAQPAPNSTLSSEVMRNQLNGLKALIDAVPAGPPGADGADGAPGEPFATAVVESVTTLDPGQPATVTATLVGNEVRLTFGIPRGSDGPPGPNGSDGGTGAPGAPGEVTAAQLADAITAALAAAASNSSANSNGIATLDTPAADPDVEAQRLKINELILALRR